MDEDGDQALAEDEAAAMGVTRGTKCQLANGDLCPGGSFSSCPESITTVTFNGSSCTVTVGGFTYPGTTHYGTGPR